MHPNVTSILKAADAMGISHELALWHRCRYLKAELRKSSDRIDFFRNHGSDVAICMAWIEHDATFLPLSRELRATARAIRGEDRQQGKDAITEERIQQAREFPIERLIEFDRSGFAPAFCHQDNKPSLHHHKARNRAHCFPCGKSFDPIAVLMTRDKLSFKDAVRELAA